MDEETRDGIIEALHNLPDVMHEADMVTAFIMMLDAYDFSLIEAIDALGKVSSIYAEHWLTEGYNPLRPN